MHTKPAEGCSALSALFKLNYRQSVKSSINTLLIMIINTLFYSLCYINLYYLHKQKQNSCLSSIFTQHHSEIGHYTAVPIPHHHTVFRAHHFYDFLKAWQSLIFCWLITNTMTEKTARSNIFYKGQMLTWVISNIINISNGLSTKRYAQKRVQTPKHQ